MIATNNEIRDWQSQVGETQSEQPEFFRFESFAAREGYKIDREILARGRNSNLVLQCKLRDDFTCQACGFKLEVDGNYIIEAHHGNPLSCTRETTTKLEDLFCLCPTCHHIAHLRKPPFDADEIRRIRSTNQQLS